jgi:hypothetical protein
VRVRACNVETCGPSPWKYGNGIIIIIMGDGLILIIAAPPSPVMPTIAAVILKLFYSYAASCKSVRGDGGGVGPQTHSHRRQVAGGASSQLA